MPPKLVLLCSCELAFVLFVLLACNSHVCVFVSSQAVVSAWSLCCLLGFAGYVLSCKPFWAVLVVCFRL